MSNRLDSATTQPAAIGASSNTTSTTSSSSKNTGVFEAKVLAKIDDTTYSVNVNNKTIIVSLPQDTKIGDMISVDIKALGSSQQRLDLETNVPAQLKSSTNLLKATEIQQRPLQDADSFNSSGQQSSVIQLSDFSRLIDTILRADTSPESPIVAPSTILTETSAMSDTHTLATELQKQLSKSGVFYESHLADWVSGKRDLKAIQSEPQARLPSLDEKGIPTNVNDVAGYKELTHLIQQQLHTLENDNLKWQGNLLPGQPLEFEIRRQQSEKKKNAYPEEAGDYWNSIVRFTLPTLGTVSATINLHSSHLSVSVHTTDELSAQVLRAYAHQFTTTLSSLGTDLDQFSIKYDGDKE
ncbi:flagellar hook-length control protein FliK [Undibacterium sp. RuRC25W]|uniref:flagellar hook-length control protein FliK n=1 Tax=Undibacterium sp. RuRC25W TaxID=3413047 RepID=UPI003BF58906